MQVDPANKIEGVEPGETKLYEIHKHWFGLVIVYVEVLIGFLAALALLWFASPFLFANSDVASRNLYISLLVGTGAILVWVFLVIFTYIYRGNRLIITDKNLTQVLRRGLFSRQVSELSMSNVEDVTANQHGFFATIFDYGVLIVETAGEQDNFDFNFCPKTNFYGKIVLEARQKYIDANPGSDRRR